MVGALMANEPSDAPGASEHPLAGLLTPEDLLQVQADEARGVAAAFVGVPMVRGYHERREAIESQGLDAVHCPTCGWPGIVVHEDETKILINHHGRAFACRIKKTA